jgi:NAD(P)-dependent dehydrogenase (short-subunit alcohol dehydrogenase family)
MATILITGSNRGIGLELVRAYVKRGDIVFAVCRTSSDALDATGARVLSNLDVTSDALLTDLPTQLGDTPLDLAILNAGVLSAENLPNIDYAAMRHQFEVNSLGPLRTAEAILPNLHAGSKIGIITSRMGSIADNTSGGM